MIDVLRRMRDRALRYEGRLTTVATVYELDRDELAELARAIAAASPIWDQSRALDEIALLLGRGSTLDELRLSMGLR